MEKHSLASVQALRAIAALSVVLYHANGYLMQLDILEFFHPFQYFGFAGVDLFFVISGFVLTYSVYGKFGRKNVVRPFLLRRGWRIYSNYWLFLIATIALTGLHLYTPSPDKDLLLSVTLWPTYNHFYFLPLAWSLSYEISFYIVLALLLGGSLRNFRRALGLWGMTVLAANIASPLDYRSPGWFAFLLSPFHLEFIAGCAAALFIKERTLPPHGKLLLAAGIVLLATVLVTQHYTILRPQERLVRALAYGVGFMLLLLGMLAWERQHKPRFPKLLLDIGDASYSLYLCHTLFFQAIHNLRLHFMPDFNPYLFVLLMVVLPVPYCLAHYRYIEKPLLDWGRKL